MIRQELIALTSEWRASSAMAFQAAAVFDKPEDAVWARMMTAMAKWYTAESAVQSANTLIELIGGMAYTTDMQAERLLRDAKVLQVWEGPKQVQARALARTIIADKNNTLSTRLWQICDAIPDCAADLRRAIARELRDLDYNVRQLKESPKSEDQIGSMLLRQAADVTALTLLSDQAAWEMVQYGDDRTVLVARHFYDQHFGERHQVKHIADALQTRFNDVARMALTSPVNDNVWSTPSENKMPRQSPRPSPK
jgi:alkylation response protein AidB-like acyl-CoA dehydrogenase